MPKSFGAKLTLSFVAVALVAVAAVITPITLLGKSDAAGELRAKALRYARFIEPQLRTVVAFNDALTAREVFAPFAADNDVSGLAVYSADGQLIEGYGHHPERLVRGARPAAPGPHKLMVVTKVVAREGPTGTLAVILSSESIATVVRRNSSTAAICAGAALVLAAIIAMLLGRSVSARLKRIGTAVNKVAEGDLAQPDIQSGAADEIGHLVSVFNVMVEKLRRQFAERKALAETEQARLEAVVTTRTAQLEESREQYRLIAESTNAIPFTYLPGRRAFAYIGPQVQKCLGYPIERWAEPGFLESVLPPEQVQTVRAHLADAAGIGETEFECALLAQYGVIRRLRWVVTPGELRGENCLRGLMLDITQQRKLESDLQQAQKLESVGRLASGVAHEINTPVQFITDNVHFLRTCTGDLSRLIAGLRASNQALLAGAPSLEAARAAVAIETAIDLTYLLDDMPKAHQSCIDGLQRVATIVRSMKEFAHPDSTEMSAINLNRAIESTLVIASNEYKYVAVMETHLGQIPPVFCYVGEVNQAVLNIIVNAAHAIGDVVKDTDRRGKITVTTRHEGDSVFISIADTGGGIPDHIRARIFDPFFTTKEVGKGTGQGLAIARSVLVDKHGGDLTVETQVGVGTTFHLRLPVAGKGKGKDSPAEEIAA
ncbi:MAG TPA: ATP-binding protein [Steroidobacteraceae bacterium]|nr:ATP-binding protein [Steroidobacteraceae bacterium]